MILEKIIPQAGCNSAVFRNLKYINVTYNHQDSNYVIKITGSHYPNSGPPYNQNKYDLESLIFPVDREKFIKHTLESFIASNSKTNLPASSTHTVIDFSSPNIAKPFHFGHLRSAIIGNFIANIKEHFRNKVTRLNYIGDWGTQFGLLQYGLNAKKLNVENLKDPIKDLYDAYVYANKLSTNNAAIQNEARKYFSDIEQGKTDIKNWKKIREMTIQELAKVYLRLGINFDCFSWESDYNGKAIMDTIKMFEKKDIFKTDVTGRKVAFINDKEITVMKSDNSTLYISRDIAALLDRYRKYNFDEMLYVVDNAQTDHFNAVFKIVKQLDEKYVRGCRHIKFGRIRGMSTRSGNVVFLDDILDEAKSRMCEKQKQSKNTRITALNEETCDTLGNTAVIINDLKQKRQRDYEFDWDKALQSEGDSGIKLQYLHCRLWSLENKNNISLPELCEPNYLPEETVGLVVAELFKFDNVLKRSCEQYEACILVGYSFHLARLVNRMFKELMVKDVSPDLARQRLLVFHSARLVVKKSLEILGVKPLHEM